MPHSPMGLFGWGYSDLCQLFSWQKSEHSSIMLASLERVRIQWRPIPSKLDPFLISPSLSQNAHSPLPFPHFSDALHRLYHYKLDAASVGQCRSPGWHCLLSGCHDMPNGTFVTPLLVQRQVQVDLGIGF